MFTKVITNFNHSWKYQHNDSTKIFQMKVIANIESCWHRNINNIEDWNNYKKQCINSLKHQKMWLLCLSLLLVYACLADSNTFESNCYRTIFWQQERLRARLHCTKISRWSSKNIRRSGTYFHSLVVEHAWKSVLASCGQLENIFRSCFHLKESLQTTAKK